MENLKKAFNAMSISYDEEMIEKFRLYMEGILEWNEKVNLTAITDRDDFIKKHFIDSLMCCNFPEVQKAETVIDVGTGGGFPGVPLSLVFPNKRFVLMDSLKKRLKIIDELSAKIGINNITTLHGRAEDLGRHSNHREKYDLCVSRAVANLATLSEYCLPFIALGGNFLAYKAVKAEEELREAKSAIFLLGGKLDREEKVALPDFELEHNIIIIDKVKNTSSKYPRKAGIPSKQPLK